MAFAARTNDGTFTGAIYEQITPVHTEHHARFDERLVEVQGLENIGTDDRPEWRALGPADPTGDDINAERTRRIVAGTDVNVTGWPDLIALQGRPEDQQTLMGLAMMAQMMIAAGNLAPITFRDRLNVAHELTPAQLVELWQRGTIWMQQVYEASWTLKALDPIPGNFADDAHWPAAGLANPET